MAKIFVSGVAGFLGSHLAERLLEEGHTVVGVDNLIGGYLDNVPAGVDFYQADCRDRELMVRLMQGVDVVYHTAAAAYEGLSVFAPLYVNEHTYMTTVSLLSAAASAKVKRFVFLSSMARYGEQQTPFMESMSALPRPVRYREGRLGDAGARDLRDARYRVGAGGPAQHHRAAPKI